MRVLVLGGTGGIGPQLIQQLLAASHHVVIYARSPQKIAEPILSNPEVTIVKGDLSDRTAFLEALEGVHAVVSALGPPVTSGPLYTSGTPLAKGYTLLLSLMKEKGIKRLIALGTASNKDSNDHFDVEFWVLVHGVATFAHNAYKEIVAIGDVVRADNELMWTIARVPVLTNTKNAVYHAGYIGDKKTKAWLPRNAFVAFVVDELEKNQWVQKAPLISAP